MKKIIMPNNYRALFISDIHGNLTVLKQLLENVNYNPDDDFLFILGDIIEKGKENLQSLHYIMELSKNDKCFVICGNCDDVLLKFNENNFEALKNYVLNNYKSIFTEIVNLLKLNVDKSTNMVEICNSVNTYLNKEIEYIKNLDKIIITNDFMVAHAGLYDNDNYENTDDNYAMHHDMQGFAKYKYPIPLIVGHWTTVFYHQTFCYNPYIDLNKNIISLDGSNSIKTAGQLNVLILEKNNKDLKFAFKSYDDLPEVNVIKNQDPTNGVKIHWPFNKIDIKSIDNGFATGYLKCYGNRGIVENDYTPILVSIPEAFTFQYDGKYYTKEFDNCLLELKIGDTVKIAYMTDKTEYVIIKHDGQVGLALKDNLNIICD